MWLKAVVLNVFQVSDKLSALSRKENPSTGHTKAARVKFASPVAEVEDKDEDKILHVSVDSKMDPEDYLQLVLLYDK